LLAFAQSLLKTIDNSTSYEVPGSFVFRSDEYLLGLWPGWKVGLNNFGENFILINLFRDFSTKWHQIRTFIFQRKWCRCTSSPGSSNGFSRTIINFNSTWFCSERWQLCALNTISLFIQNLNFFTSNKV
jgi:hypothetical protein